MSYYVGIDVGSSKIGLAISDSEKKIAFPLDVIIREQNSYGFNKIKRIIEGKDVEAFIVGLPIKTNGSIGKQGEEIQRYARCLKDHFHMRVIVWDERYTTVLSEKTLLQGNIRREKRKQIIDKLAAQNILQSYLDYINNQKRG